MPENVDMRRVWTTWEIRDSMYVLDWLRAEISDPEELPAHARGTVTLDGLLTPMEIRDNDDVACELIRHYSPRLN